MSRLLSLALIAVLQIVPVVMAEDLPGNNWIIREKNDPFSGQIKSSAHVEFRTTDSKTQLPLYASIDITRQPKRRSSVAALGLISHYSPQKPQPVVSPARVITVTVDNNPATAITAYYQTDMGSAFGTRHWYLVDLDCEVLVQLAAGEVLKLDTPEPSTINLGGAGPVLSRVVPACF